MEIVTSWDDGAKEDVRIAELLRKYELPGIFFIANVTNQLTEAEIRAIADDFELGGHTMSHPHDIKLLKPWEAEEDIRYNKDWLEDIGQKELEWFCYPRGRYNGETIDAVKNCGFTKARTTIVNEITLGDDMFRIPTAIHAYRHRKEYRGRDWVHHAIQLYDLAKNTQNSYYHIWGHSWEIEQQGSWSELERLLAHIYNDKNN